MNLLASREDVQAFLGFGHVAGIKQWDAEEKAGFICHLVDDRKRTYEQVARQIGSTTPAVRRHYIAFSLLRQMEQRVEGFPRANAARRFAMLYDSIQKAGIQNYLGIDLYASPQRARTGVSTRRRVRLAHFCRWLYGTETSRALLSDTRQVAVLGEILECPEALKYLETTIEPKFDAAYGIAARGRVYDFQFSRGESR